ncbi:MAG TPA: hypothetical protein VGE52_11220 [Pirellulales bacterium]
MDRWQFSVRGLLIGFVVVAGSLAAMTISSPWIASSVYTLEIVLLATAVCGAALGEPRVRAFWSGWLAFGAVYVIATGGSVFLLPAGAAGNNRPRLLTEPLLEYLSQWHGPPMLGALVQAQWNNGSYYAAKITQVQNGQYEVTWTDGSAPSWVTAAQIKGDLTSFTAQGHCVFGLLFAWAGGLFVRSAFGPRVSPPVAATSVSPAIAPDPAFAAASPDPSPPTATRNAPSAPASATKSVGADSVTLGRTEVVA